MANRNGRWEARVLWTGETFQERLPTAITVVRLSGTTVWVGRADGQVITWQLSDPSSPKLHPYRILTAHRHPLLSIGDTDAGVLTIDAGGLACLWDAATAECTASRLLGIHPQACMLQLSAGLVALENQLMSKGGNLSSVGGLAIIDTSLHIVERLSPVSLLPLVHPHVPGAKAAGVGAILAMCQPSAAVIVGMTQQGLLLRWQLGPCRETQGGQHTVKEHSLAGNLLAAAFSSDSRHLFLVASGGWLLLTSPDAWSSIVMAAGHSEAPPQAALLGGMLLEGVHESDGSGNQAALVWDAAGAGRLLGFRTGQSWELILSLSLPQDCGPRCVAAFDGGHAIVAVPSQGSHIEPSLVQLHGEQQAELLGPREAVFPRVSNGNGTLHSPQKEQADVSTDRALVCMVARKSSHAADICFKGYESGVITAEPLAAVALGLHMKQSAAKGSLPWGLHAHEGEVTCLLEHSCRLPDTDGVSEAATLLLSGGADGCVHAVHARSGSCHFRLSLHTAEVVALSAPPQGTAHPWGSHALSYAADGSFCLIALEHGQCLHLLSSTPSPLADGRPGFLWSAVKGYIAGFSGFRAAGLDGSIAALESPLWAGQRRHSRLFAGQHSAAVLWDFQSGRQDRQIRGAAAEELIRDLAMHQPALLPAPLGPGIFCMAQESPLHSAHVLHVDVMAILTHQPDSSGGWGDQTSSGGLLLTALALLHTMGLDPGVDALFLQALILAGISQGYSLEPADATLSDVHFGANGAITLSFPASGNPGAWTLNSDRVANHLLAVVALAKGLQALSAETTDDGLSAGLCNLAAGIIALYTVRLPELLPSVPRSSILALAAHFQEEEPSMREAARTLLATAADPAVHGLPDPAPYDALASLIHYNTVHVRNSLRSRQGGEPWRAAHIMAAAAICMLHPSSVPEELAAHALPGLVAVACARGGSCVRACGLLAECLGDAALARWRGFLGDTATLTKRLLEACEAAAAEAAARPTSAQQRSPSNAALTLKSPQSLPQHMDGPLQKREALLGTLAAVAAADLRTFLHMLGHRLAVGGQASSHLFSLMTLVRVLHSSGGRQLMISHLHLLTAVVLKGLEPPHTGLRRACRQSVLALVKELSLSCPMVALHESSLQLAVGRAAAVALSSTEAAAAGEPVSVHDLTNGRKKRAVHFRLEGSLGGGDAGEVVAALAFSSSGEALAGWSPSEGSLRVWQLVAKWSDRLQRGPALLTPSQVFKMAVPAAMSSRGEHPWGLAWEGDTAVQVLYGGNCIGRAVLQQ